MRHKKLLGTASFVLVAALAACTPSTGSAGQQPEPEAAQSQPDQQDTDHSTEPQPEADGPKTPEQHWQSMTLRQQVSSVLMLHHPGTDVDELAQFVEEIQPGGMILMGDGIPDPESELAQQIPQWAHVGDLPLLVATDQEGGIVSRLDHDPGRPAVELRDGDPAITEDSFHERAEYLKSLGINTNFGIIADVTDDQNSFIWSRILGSTPEDAAQQVAAAVMGEQGEVFSALKHFPGHGTVEADSHLSVPTADLDYEEWMAGPAIPFIAGLNAGAEMVMMGHLRFPEIADQPASLSPQWHEILRENLGFAGVIVTDDMKMLRDSGVEEYADPTQNALAALNAGSTLILDIGGDTGETYTQFANSLIDGLVRAVESGDLTEETLKNAGLRVLEMRTELTD